jgi:tetratricopeptide (TPR) repeat protein
MHSRYSVINPVVAVLPGKHRTGTAQEVYPLRRRRLSGVPHGFRRIVSGIVLLFVSTAILASPRHSPATWPEYGTTAYSASALRQAARGGLDKVRFYEDFAYAHAPGVEHRPLSLGYADGRIEPEAYYAAFGGDNVFTRVGRWFVSLFQRRSDDVILGSRGGDPDPEPVPIGPRGGTRILDNDVKLKWRGGKPPFRVRLWFRQEANQIWTNAESGIPELDVPAGAVPDEDGLFSVPVRLPPADQRRLWSWAVTRWTNAETNQIKNLDVTKDQDLQAHRAWFHQPSQATTDQFRSQLNTLGDQLTDLDLAALLKAVENGTGGDGWDMDDFQDLPAFAKALLNPEAAVPAAPAPLSARLREAVTPGLVNALISARGVALESAKISFVNRLNELTQTDALYAPALLEGVTLSPRSRARIQAGTAGAAVIGTNVRGQLNRIVLEAAYPQLIRRNEPALADLPNVDRRKLAQALLRGLACMDAGYPYEALNLFSPLRSVYNNQLFLFKLCRHLMEQDVAFFQPALLNQNTVGLFVGISKYQSPDFQELPTAAPQAKAMYEFVSEAIKSHNPQFQTDSQLRLLTSDIPEKTTQQYLQEDILDDWLPQALNNLQDATLVLYFGCHAVEEPTGDDVRLVPVDGQRKTGGGVKRGISLDRIANFISNNAEHVRQVVVILDTCNSGFLANRLQSHFDLRQHDQRPDVLVLCASKENQNAAATGRFTEGLLRALKGGQAREGIYSARETLDDAPTWVDRNKQTPIQWSTGIQFPLVEIPLVPLGTATTSPPIPLMTARGASPALHVISASPLREYSNRHSLRVASVSTTSSLYPTPPYRGWDVTSEATATGLRRAGRYRSALNILEQNRLEYAAQRDVVGQMRVLVATGDILREAGLSEEASNAYRSALSVAEKSENPNAEEVRHWRTLCLARIYEAVTDGAVVRTDIKSGTPVKSGYDSPTARATVPANANAPAQASPESSLRRAKELYEGLWKESSRGFFGIQALYSIAQIQNRLGNYEDAQRQFDDTDNLHPQDPEVLGRIYLALGDLEVLVSDRRVRANVQDAAANAARNSEIDRDVAQRAENFYRKALDQARSAKALDPKDPNAGTLDLEASIYQSLGRLRLRERDSRGATEGLYNGVEALEQLLDRLELPEGADLVRFVTRRRPLYTDYIEALVGDSRAVDALAVAELLHSHSAPGSNAPDSPADLNTMQSWVTRTSVGLLVHVAVPNRLFTWSVLPNRSVSFREDTRGTTAHLNQLLGKIRNGSGSSAPSDSQITALFQDSRGGLWYGTQSAGAYYRPKGGAWRYLPSAGRGNLTSHYVTSFAQTQNTVWIGTDKGINTYDLSADRLSTVPSKGTAPYSYIRVLSSLGDERGRFWMGTDEGLYLLDQGVWSNVLPSQSVRALLQDNEAGILAGTDRGLFTVGRNSSGWAALPAKGSPSCAVIALCRDSKQRLWCGTEEGLYELSSSGEGSKVWRKDAIPDESITSLALDATGTRLWVGTQGGVAAYDLSAERWLKDAGEGFKHKHHNVVVVSSKGGPPLAAEGTRLFQRQGEAWSRIDGPSSVQASDAERAAKDLGSMLLPPGLPASIAKGKPLSLAFVLDGPLADTPYDALGGRPKAGSPARPIMLEYSAGRLIAAGSSTRVPLPTGSLPGTLSVLTYLTTRELVVQSLSRRGVVALEATFQDNGEAGTLQLGGGGATFGLSAAEIKALPFRTDVVLLSARGGASPHSVNLFTNALRAAGVSTVILCPPIISDEALTLFRTSFYDFIRQGQTPSEAVAAAQTRVGQEYLEFSEWGPFRLLGAGNVPVVSNP